MPPAADEALITVLVRAQELGFLGPGPVGGHLPHSRGFARALGHWPVGVRALDLGSGGGVPGLVLALDHPDSSWTLLDSSERRAAFLTDAVATLNLSSRVTVVRERAELVGREPAHRSHYGLVTARSFGPPAVVAECAAGLLGPGGRLVVSEPPDVQDRWPEEPLASLGLARMSVSESGYTVLAMERACPDRYPRRVGIPGKRPLF